MMTSKRSQAAMTIWLCASLVACASTVPNREPTGEAFPSIQGQSLAGETYKLPDDLKGEPVVLIVAFKQDTQFDVDRWALGMLQVGVNAKIFELPTVESAIAGAFSDRIDEGMRSGIPDGDWGGVITIYDDAQKVVNFVGNERPRNARVLLLNAQGEVVWFQDEGYSPRLALELKETIDALRGGAEAAQQGAAPSSDEATVKDEAQGDGDSEGPPATQESATDEPSAGQTKEGESP